MLLKPGDSEGRGGRGPWLRHGNGTFSASCRILHSVRRSHYVTVWALDHLCCSTCCRTGVQAARWQALLK